MFVLHVCFVLCCRNTRSTQCTRCCSWWFAVRRYSIECSARCCTESNETLLFPDNKVSECYTVSEGLTANLLHYVTLAAEQLDAVGACNLCQGSCSHRFLQLAPSCSGKILFKNSGMWVVIQIGTIIKCLVACEASHPSKNVKRICPHLLELSAKRDELSLSCSGKNSLKISCMCDMDHLRNQVSRWHSHIHDRNIIKIYPQLFELSCRQTDRDKNMISLTEVIISLLSLFASVFTTAFNSRHNIYMVVQWLMIQSDLDDINLP